MIEMKRSDLGRGEDSFVVCRFRQNQVRRHYCTQTRIGVHGKMCGVAKRKRAYDSVLCCVAFDEERMRRIHGCDFFGFGLGCGERRWLAAEGVPDGKKCARRGCARVRRAQIGGGARRHDDGVILDDVPVVVAHQRAEWQVGEDRIGHDHECVRIYREVRDWCKENLFPRASRESASMQYAPPGVPKTASRMVKVELRRGVCSSTAARPKSS